MASKYSNLIQQILLTATLGLFGFSPISFVNILTLSITIVQETSLQSHPLDLRTLLAVNELIFSCASFSIDKDWVSFQVLQGEFVVSQNDCWKCWNQNYSFPPKSLKLTSSSSLNLDCIHISWKGSCCLLLSFRRLAIKQYIFELSYSSNLKMSWLNLFFLKSKSNRIRGKVQLLKMNPRIFRVKKVSK